MIYATLLWCQARGVAPPQAARQLLDDLAAVAQPRGRGLRWPRRTDEAIGGGYWAGWCAGQAGHVFGGMLAASAYQEPALIDYAERAAWTVWQHPSPLISLCCGVAGQAYALLSLYRACGERAWHLRHIFSKLGIGSRTQVASKLQQGEDRKSLTVAN